MNSRSLRRSRRRQRIARILTLTLGLAALWTIVSFATKSAAMPTTNDKAAVFHDDTRTLGEDHLDGAPV